MGGWVTYVAAVGGAGRPTLEPHDGIDVQVAGGVVGMGLCGWVGGWVDRKMEEDETVGMRCCGLRVGGWVYLAGVEDGFEVRDVDLNEGHEAEGKAEAGKEGVAVEMPRESGWVGG